MWLPKLHPEQAKFVNDPTRIVAAACGTKTGKTFGLANWAIQEAWNRPQALVWWCAPVYKQAQIAFRHIGLMLPPGRFKKRASQGEMVYELLYTDGRTRSIIDFRSAERPESLRGDGVHAAVIDEAGYWKRDSFVSVMTTLTRTMGKLRIISTPKGRSWFYEEWLRGWCPKCKTSNKRCPCPPGRNEDPSFSSYQLPTSANPHVSREAIETAKRVLTDNQFKQEYLAEFLADGAGVFTNVISSQQALFLDKPLPGRRYVVGIDWAKEEDYTVFVVMDADTKRVVFMERFNGLDWNVSIDKAIRCAKYWNRAAVMMDSTGVGSPPFDAMAAIYPQVEGYNIYNNERKVALIQRLQLALERREIQLPSPLLQTSPERNELANLMEHELTMYSSTISATGKFQFGAPEGYHDDIVIALALVVFKVSEAPMIYQWDSVAGV